MFSKINHVAIVSENYAQLAQFYEAVFGMKTSAKTRAGRAVTVGDGYVGLNINPRRAGRSAGLDHFGIQVEDVRDGVRPHAQEISDREVAQAPVQPAVRRHHHPRSGRQRVRHLAEGHGQPHRRSMWRTTARPIARHINHVAMRTMRPDEMAEFYRDVFELAPSERRQGRATPIITSPTAM